MSSSAQHHLQRIRDRIIWPHKVNGSQLTDVEAALSRVAEAAREIERERREHRPVRGTEPGTSYSVCQTCLVVWPCTASTRIDAALASLVGSKENPDA